MDEKLKILHVTSTKAARYFGVTVRTMWDYRHKKCPVHILKHMDMLIEFHRMLKELREK